jgi:hypothetical protein
MRRVGHLSEQLPLALIPTTSRPSFDGYNKSRFGELGATLVDSSCAVDLTRTTDILRTSLARCQRRS